jgi:hypothetical protein
MLTPPDRPNYVVEAVILGQVGPVPAVVHAILKAYEDNGVTEMTHQQVAKAAGISHKTVKRTLEKLYEAELSKSESQYRGKGRIANLYRAPTLGQTDPTPQVKMTHPPGQNDLPPGQNDLPNRDEEETRVIPGQEPVSTSTVGTSEKSRLSVFSEENLPLSRGCLRQPGVETSFPTDGEDVLDNLGDFLRSPGTYPTTPPPVASRKSGAFPNLLDQFEQARWLVAYFEVPVLSVANQERQARGKNSQPSVGDNRLTRWFSSAMTLVRDHSLEEVVKVIDWVFAKCDGVLPKSVVEDDRLRASERKLTRLAQIVACWDALVEEMTMGPKAPMSLMEVLQATQNQGATR